MCLLENEYIYIYTHTHTHTHIYIYIYIYIYMLGIEYSNCHFTCAFGVSECWIVSVVTSDGIGGKRGE